MFGATPGSRVGARARPTSPANHNRAKGPRTHEDQERYGQRLGDDKPARDFHKRRAIGIGGGPSKMVKPTPADLIAALRSAADQLADVETPAAQAERENEAERARQEHLDKSRALRQLARGIYVPGLDD